MESHVEFDMETIHDRKKGFTVEGNRGVGLRSSGIYSSGFFGLGSGLSWFREVVAVYGLGFLRFW